MQLLTHWLMAAGPHVGASRLRLVHRRTIRWKGDVCGRIGRQLARSRALLIALDPSFFTAPAAPSADAPTCTTQVRPSGLLCLQLNAARPACVLYRNDTSLAMPHGTAAGVGPVPVHRASSPPNPGCFPLATTPSLSCYPSQPAHLAVPARLAPCKNPKSNAVSISNRSPCSSVFVDTLTWPTTIALGLNTANFPYIGSVIQTGPNTDGYRLTQITVNMSNSADSVCAGCLVSWELWVSALHGDKPQQAVALHRDRSAANLCLVVMTPCLAMFVARLSVRRFGAPAHTALPHLLAAAPVCPLLQSFNTTTNTPQAVIPGTAQSVAADLPVKGSMAPVTFPLETPWTLAPNTSYAVVTMPPQAGYIYTVGTGAGTPVTAAGWTTMGTAIMESGERYRGVPACCSVLQAS